MSACVYFFRGRHPFDYTWKNGNRPTLTGPRITHTHIQNLVFPTDHEQKVNLGRPTYQGLPHAIWECV